MVALASVLALGQDEAGPVVTTVKGQLRGSTGQSRDGRMFYSFTGVPYGKILERFKAPVAADNWEDVKDATQPAPKCIQYSPLSKEIVGQEDCLNLNVFTPRVS